jgi:hypothetical protein
MFNLAYCLLTMLIAVILTFCILIWPKYGKFFLLASLINVVQNVVWLAVMVVKAVY